MQEEGLVGQEGEEKMEVVKATAVVVGSVAEEMATVAEAVKAVEVGATAVAWTVDCWEMEAVRPEAA
jgi:hypothetical protein